jgi:hypothetical protein
MEKQKMLALIETYDAIPFVDEWNGKKIPDEFEFKKFPIPFNIEPADCLAFPQIYNQSPLYTYIICRQKWASDNSKIVSIEKLKNFHKNPEKDIEFHNKYLANHPEGIPQSPYKYCLGEVKYKKYHALIFLQDDQNNTIPKGSIINYDLIFFINEDGRYYIAGASDLQDEELKDFEVSVGYGLKESQYLHNIFSTSKPSS